MTTASHSWLRHDWVGTASDFHSKDLPAERALWLCSAEKPALILGSTQDESDVRVDVAVGSGIEIVRRRSGGGAVYVAPDESVWMDITISREDPLWQDDVSTSMLWLGDVFVQALQPWVHAETFRGTFHNGHIGRAVCFASAAPGEVFVGDNKLVGISQRRNREGARFQCVVYRQWNPLVWSSLLASVDVQEHVRNMRVATIAAPARDIADAVMAALATLTPA
jgi:lipoate-protein ligase A